MKEKESLSKFLIKAQEEERRKIARELHDEIGQILIKYGLDVLEKMKELDPNVKVIIASADIQKQTKDLAIEKGAFAFINKPFNEEEILNLLSEIGG